MLDLVRGADEDDTRFSFEFSCQMKCLKVLFESAHQALVLLSRRVDGHSTSLERESIRVRLREKKTVFFNILDYFFFFFHDLFYRLKQL